MTTKIQKWGNSQGLRLAKHLLERAELNVGDDVDVEVQAEQIVIKKHHVKPAYTLEYLLEDYGETDAEVDWGEPVGKEVW